MLILESPSAMLKKVKAVADEITDNIDNNGIYNSMKKHNLI